MRFVVVRLPKRDMEVLGRRARVAGCSRRALVRAAVRRHLLYP